MDASSHSGESAIAAIAAAIGEPARARMLVCLLDGHARTATELASVAEISASTASVHLQRLRQSQLVQVVRQGKHRYYRLRTPEVAAVLEGLSILAASADRAFTPPTPPPLRAARTCYDHLAGTVGVALHDRWLALGWLTAARSNEPNYTLSAPGSHAFTALNIDLAATRALRRRFACGCLDWSERRMHLGGALGAAFLSAVLKRKWLLPDLDSRALRPTSLGRRELRQRFGVEI